MATDINWPTGLRPAIRSSRSRNQVVGAREAPVTSGPSFVEPFSDDTPTFYDVQFIFTPQEARAFESWLRQYRILRNLPFFNFPIEIEDPNVSTQEARFTAEGYPQQTSRNPLSTYSATLLVRNIATDDEGHDEFILQLSEATGYQATSWCRDFDIVMNTDYSNA